LADTEITKERKRFGGLSNYMSQTLDERSTLREGDSDFAILMLDPDWTPDHPQEVLRIAADTREVTLDSKRK
jgi:hypothetical protein